MKFSTPVVLLATGAFAAPSPSELCERELSTVNTIMTTVLNGIQTLDGAICGYNGGAGAELEQAAGTMLTTIRTATYNAVAMLPLTMDEAIAFQPLSDQLNAAGDKLLVDLSDKVDLFAKSGACDSTLTWVAQVGSNVNTLMTSISVKFPAGGKGGDEIKHFNGIFSEMQDKLSGCSTGGKGSGSGSGSGSSSGSGSGSGSASGGDVKVVGSATQVLPVPTAVYTAPAGAAGNGTKGVSPISTNRPVVTAGAALVTFSGAALAAAAAAFIL